MVFLVSQKNNPIFANALPTMNHPIDGSNMFKQLYTSLKLPASDYFHQAT